MAKQLSMTVLMSFVHAKNYCKRGWYDLIDAFNYFFPGNFPMVMLEEVACLCRAHILTMHPLLEGMTSVKEAESKMGPSLEIDPLPESIVAQIRDRMAKVELDRVGMMMAQGTIATSSRVKEMEAENDNSGENQESAG